MTTILQKFLRPRPDGRPPERTSRSYLNAERLASNYAHLVICHTTRVATHREMFTPCNFVLDRVHFPTAINMSEVDLISWTKLAVFDLKLKIHAPKADTF